MCFTGYTEEVGSILEATIDERRREQEATMETQRLSSQEVQEDQEEETKEEDPLCEPESEAECGGAASGSQQPCKKQRTTSE